MTVIAAALLLLVIAAYSVLTFLPLRYTDCPYQTPLSGAVWSLWRCLNFRRKLRSGESMVERVTRNARQDSTARTARDCEALTWTVKSLADNFLQLEPFVGALADALGDRAHPHRAYSEHIRHLASHPDLQLCFRIQSLYDTCLDGVMAVEPRNRRQIACYKGLWAISSLSTPGGADVHLLSDFHTSQAYHEWRHADLDREVNHYAVSAGAMMKWGAYCAVYSQLVQQSHYLATFQGNSRCSSAPDFAPAAALFRHLAGACGFYLNGDPHSILLSRLTDVSQVLKLIHHFQHSAPHTILFEYLRKSAALPVQPYRWEATMRAIGIDRSLPFPVFQQPLEWNIATLLHSKPGWKIPDASEFLWRDTAIMELCFFWRPETIIAIPSCMISYLNERNSNSVLTQFAGRSRITPYLLSCFPYTMSEGASLSMHEDISHRSSPEQVLTSLWNLAASDDLRHIQNAVLYQGLLEAVSTTRFHAISVSLLALIKYRILRLAYFGLRRSEARPKAVEVLNSVNWFLLPTDTTSGSREHESSNASMQGRFDEAIVHLLAEFLEQCCSQGMPAPYKAAETLGIIALGPPFVPVIRTQGPLTTSAAVHQSHQIRLATVIQDIFSANGFDFMKTLKNALISSSFLDHPSWRFSDPVAREILRTVFSHHEETSASSNPEVMLRVRAILNGLDTECG
ncbi:hypothetical protein DFH06DRAFT_1342847 [Mycena polygramma]|nr:hypothetical protein DFH06DRAFT_1342847 [Mycena polygramma]